MNKETNNQEKKMTMHRSFEGEVIKVKDKTASVRVLMRKSHPKYKKQYTTGKKYQVHDEKNQARIGDMIRFVECRPLSKTKRWRLQTVIKL